jgi:hypothetical protein
VVFLAWYAAVERLGVARTGLFNGLIPVASLAAVAVAGTGTGTGSLVLGAVAVLAGLLVGLTGPADRAAGAGVDATARRPGAWRRQDPGPTARRRGRRATPGGPRVGTHLAPARSPATLVQATTTNRPPQRL